MSDTDHVETIRAASRTLVRELGFMGRKLAETDLSASGVHALLEIGGGCGITAKHLADVLLLEKSTVSRLVRTLVERGEVQETTDRNDARHKRLHLTARGKRTLAAVDRFATERVTGAISPLPRATRETIAGGLSAYAQALQAGRRNSEDNPAQSVAIEPGYEPGLVGHIAKMHGQAYHRLSGFGAPFEAAVAGGLAEFAPRLENPANQIWTARQAGRIVGSIAIDGEDLGQDTAHLRWFLVDEAGRGAGTGSKLLQAAMGHCDLHGFARIRLWTYRGLDIARRLYEKHGFVLTDEYDGDQWGQDLREQVFVREAAADIKRA